MGITENDIRKHTGGTYFMRGRAYFNEGRVIEISQTDDFIHGHIDGQRAEDYYAEVELSPDDHLIEASVCSCPIGGACKHVAALLLQAIEEDYFKTTLSPHTRANAKKKAPHFKTREEVMAWGERRFIDYELSLPISHLADDYVFPQSFELIADLFCHAFSIYPTYYEPQREKVYTMLNGITAHRKKAALYSKKAETWRKIPPKEAAVLPLWTRLREALKTLSPCYHCLIQRPSEDHLRVQSSPPTFTIREDLPYHQSYHVRLDEEDGFNNLHPVVPSVILDLLTDPTFAQSALRHAFIRQYSMKPWERALFDLDAIIDLAEPAATPESREYGWRITQEHGELKLRAISGVRYKTKEGYRTRNERLENVPTQRQQDLLAVDALKHDESLSYYRTPNSERTHHLKAISHLVDHPFVLTKSGQRVAVREQTLTFDWGSTKDKGLSISGRVGGKKLTNKENARLLRFLHLNTSVLFDGAQRRCWIIPVSTMQIKLIELLTKWGGRFPPEAREPLMTRFSSLNAHLNMRLKKELRGTLIDADPRLLVRLRLEPDGLLEVQALIAPIIDGPAYPPGEGPEQLYAMVDERRVYVQRTLKQEVKCATKQLAPLTLDDADDFTWLFSELDDGLTLAALLQEHPDRFRVEWTKEKARISQQATADQLKVEAKKKRDWFGLSGQLEVDGQQLSLAQLLRAVRDKRKFIKVGESDWISLTDQLREKLEGLAHLVRDSDDNIELNGMASGPLLALEEMGAELEVPETLRVQHDALRESATLTIALPKGLNATLRPYQLDGFRWLSRLAHWAPGAVLADDMGLGKTLQALTLLLRRASLGPALVVAPASVGVNWCREAARFAPSLEVTLYRGPQRKTLLNTLKPGSLLITSWELMTRDVEALGALGLSTVILDEAQAIKNANTKRARASAQLNAGFTVALTGTPVENRCGELWSLMRTTVPGLLASAQRFRERFVVPIERHDDTQARRTLSLLLRPFLLRRIKSEVALDLPSRSDSVIAIELSPSERKHYDTFRVAALAELNGDGAPEEAQGRRFRILAALTRLRQLACHPGLVHTKNPPKSSSKLDRLIEMLVDLKAEGHQALVFSQFTTLLKLARTAVEAAGLTVRYLDGSVSLKKRQREVDAFQDGQGDVFLISLKAGGTGLNLTAASYVFHLDPWWNPAVEDQATDRAHRIGQTQPVMVFRLVSTDTIEEQVLAMHAQKRTLVANLLEGTGHSAAMSPGELMHILES